MVTKYARRLSFIALFSLVLLLNTPTATSQVTQDLPFDLVVEGTLNETSPEARFRFVGQADDWISIQLRSLDRSLTNPLHTPVLRLESPDGTVHVDTTPQGALDDVTLVTRLPYDGDWFIIAGRDPRSLPRAYGDFSLVVRRIPLLLPDAPVTAVLSSDDEHLYVVAAAQPVSLRFSRQAGGFSPQVIAARLDAASGLLQPIAAGFGPELHDVTLAGLGTARPLHIRVMRHGDDSTYTETELTYTLQLTMMPDP